MSKTNLRSLSGPAYGLLQALYYLIFVVAIVWAFDLSLVFDLSFQRAQYLALFLALVLLATYIAYAPVSRERRQTTLPLYDLVLGLVAFASAGYPAYAYTELVDSLHLMSSHVVALGAMTIVLTLEALRRVAGWSLVTIGLVFIGYAFLSEYMPGDFYNRAVSAERLAMYLYLDANAILGTPLAISMGIVLAFIFFGNCLSRTGAGDLYTNLAAILMGRFSGGAGKISVSASALMGSISGSAVSNVVSTGVITIPLMKRSGFRPVQAAAIEACASSGGQLLPPVMGASAFLMAEFLNIPYSQVALAALLPALLFFAVIFGYVHVLAVKHRIAGVESTAASGLRNLLIGSLYLLPLVVLVYALFFLSMRPERAAYLSAFATLLIHIVLTRGRSIRDYPVIVTETAQMTLQIALITAAAGIVIGVLNLTGLGFALTLVLTKVGGTSLVLLLVLVAAVSMVLGMGMPTTGVYLILAVLVAPAIVALDVTPLAAHLFILYFGMFSFITPPVCFASFAAASIAGTGPMRTGFESMKVVLGAYFVPFIFVFRPELLMIGEPWAIALAAALTLGALHLLIQCALGFGRGPLPVPTRVFAGIAAAGALIALCATGPLTAYLVATAFLAVGYLLVLRIGPRPTPPRMTTQALSG